MQERYQIFLTLGAKINRSICQEAEAGSGNMLLQYMGLYWFIFFENQDGKTVTSQYIESETNLSRTVISRLTSELERLGLITRQNIAIKSGKGRPTIAYHADIPAEKARLIMKQHLNIEEE